MQIPSFRSFCQSWIVAPYLIAVIVLTLPALLQPASTEEAGNLISLGLAAERTGPWQPARLDALVLPDNHAWLRAVFTVPLSGLAADSPPLGLYLSGTFSARVIWNGQEVGHKGEPAVSREGEIPGPVDAIIHLPAEALSPGNNTALIELSSHFRQNSLNSILHGGDALPGLRLASYSSEVRRPISYYAAPLITFVLLAVAAFVLLTVTAHQRTLALVLVAALMISAAAEIFRAFYAYPYSWHMLRLGLLASAALVFACALPFYTAARAGVSLPTWLLPTLVVAGIAAILWVGPPQDVVHGVLWLYVPISIAFAIRATWRGISDSAMLLGALVCLMISLLLDSGRFFDQYLYVAVIPLMAALCRPKPARPLPLPEKTEPARLIVHSAGRQRVIDINEILAIQGAGNYAEIKLAGGETVLDDRSLKALLTLLPASFVRVHRSHLANLDDVTELRSLGAGKYELLLSRGQRCPVSRAQVQRIRDQLGLAQRADA